MSFKKQEQKPKLKDIMAQILSVDELYTIPASSLRTDAIRKVVESVKPHIFSLKHMGFFDIFTPLEWLNNIQKPARIWIGLLYLETFCRKLSSQEKGKVLTTLENIKTNVQDPLLQEKINVILNQL